MVATEVEKVGRGDGAGGVEGGKGDLAARNKWR